MSSISVLNNQEVLGRDFTVYGDIDNPLFLAKDVAEWIEYNKDKRGNYNVSEMLETVDEDEKVKIFTSLLDLSNAHTPAIPMGPTNRWFLTEDGLYEVLMQSRKPIAKQFKKEVKAILKQLRKTGVVITESATQEAIDYESKFGIRRIRKTFRETTKLEETWNEFKTVSKIERDARRINNDTRIKCCSIIVDELQDYLANNIANMRTYEVIMYREIIQEILAEKNRLTNKYYGGLLSSQTKQIKKLEQQVSELEQEEFEPDWKLIQNHGYTINTKLVYSESLHRLVYSNSYNAWLNNFDYSDFRPLNCDITKPMVLYIHFGKKAEFDTANLEKTTIDLIADYYGFDDNLITSKITSSEVVNSYEEGFICFDLINEDE